MFTTISPNLLVHPPTLITYSDSPCQDEDIEPTLTLIGTQMTSNTLEQVTAEPTHATRNHVYHDISESIRAPPHS
jgi:hypothetical protein